MATPITFSPYLNWVDATDPNNIPAGIRIISASDLLRYENFAVAARDRINSIESTVETHTGTIADHDDEIASNTTDIGTLNTWKTSATTDIANLKKQRALATKTANYTTTAADSVIIGNGAGTITITLLSAVTATAGRVFTIKNRATAALTVASAAGTIDGAATKSLAQWASLSVVSDGANWYTI
jgi:hypothetical protein